MYPEERNPPNWARPPKKDPFKVLKSLLPSQHLEPILGLERRISSPSLSTARGVCFSKSQVVFWAWKIHSARLGSVKGAQQLLQRWDDLEAFGVEELVKLVDVAGQEDGGGKR